MSKGHEGQWHYVRRTLPIVGTVFFVVADHDGDQVSRWATEADAQKTVRDHNAKLVKNPYWLY